MAGRQDMGLAGLHEEKIPQKPKRLWARLPHREASRSAHFTSKKTHYWWDGPHRNDSPMETQSDQRRSMPWLSILTTSVWAKLPHTEICATVDSVMSKGKKEAIHECIPFHCHISPHMRRTAQPQVCATVSSVTPAVQTWTHPIDCALPI